MSAGAGADFVAQAPLLAGLSPEARGRVADRLRALEIPAGSWLFRQGDEARSAYFVRSGRFELIDEATTEPTRFGEVRRGAVLGELALLRNETRSASARARRDSEVLELRREEFDELLRVEAEFAIGLTRSLAAQLGSTRPTTPRTAPIVSTAVVGLDAQAPARLVAERLADSLRRYGTVANLGDAEGNRPAGDLPGLLDAAEREHDRVVLWGRAWTPGDPWVECRLREADLVVAVASRALEPPWLARTESLQGCELLIAGPPLADDELYLAARQVTVRPTGEALGLAVDALARRLAGRSLGLVLSGGGARAMAHIGVFEELHGAGLRFDRVAGVSLGSLVAGAIALDWTPEHVYEVFADSFLEANPASDYTIPVAAFLRGAKTRALLAKLAGDVRIEELPKIFFCLSCDIVAREIFVHRTGLARDAVYASLAIPGVFPPLRTVDGRLLVDGGVLDNLPAEAMARSGEGPVVASDVTRDGQWASKRRVLPSAVAGPARRALTGSEVPLPRLGETLLRSFTLGSIDTAAAARRHAALSVMPEVDGIGLMDWKALSRARDAGRRAAQKALEQGGAELL